MIINVKSFNVESISCMKAYNKQSIFLKLLVAISQIPSKAKGGLYKVKTFLKDKKVKCFLF